MKLLQRLFNHIHYFDKPIASKYVSFHTRDIIYECRCGKRKVVREHRRFGEPFPIETNILITQKEFESILNNSPVS